MKYKHIKTGKIYRKIEEQEVKLVNGLVVEIIDVVIYTDGTNRYVRDKYMFDKKFKQVSK